MSVRRVHGIALLVGAAVASVLLAVSVVGLMRAQVAAGVVALVLAVAIGAACWGVAVASWRGGNAPPDASRARWWVLPAFPVALVGSTMDCGGFDGCTPLCGFLSGPWLAVLTVAVVAALVRPSRGVLLATSLLSFVLLVPHCDCNNLVNRPWIALLGLSPACFSGSFAVGVASVGAVASGRFLRLAGAAGWLTAAALVAGGLAHHRLHWPW